jgi:hypothetical protein
LDRWHYQRNTGRSANRKDENQGRSLQAAACHRNTFRIHDTYSNARALLRNATGGRPSTRTEISLRTGFQSTKTVLRQARSRSREYAVQQTETATTH